MKMIGKILVAISVAIVFGFPLYLIFMATIGNLIKLLTAV